MISGKSVRCLGIVLILKCCLRVASGDNYQSVQDVQTAMYTTMQYTGGWYLNLNVSGTIGTKTPVAKQPVSGVLMSVTNVQWPLTSPRILVSSLGDMEGTLERLLSDPVSRANCIGMLVDPTGPPPSTLSSASTFPGAFNAPYSDTSYVWNPPGSDLARASLPFPVVYVTASLARNIAAKTSYNNNQAYKGALYQADITLSMMASVNSTHCLLVTGGCQPLGGYSVWATMPPQAPLFPGLTDPKALMQGLGNIAAPSSMPITLVTSQINSNSLFHDYTMGSDSPLSGLISMLVAMDILAQTNASATYTRQLAFLALAGESWDYMGSRRLLLDMNMNTTSTSGLNLTLIDQVIEMGQVGRGFDMSANMSALYVHMMRTNQTAQQYGDTNALVSALMTSASNNVEQPLILRQSSASNPGIPPSSLMSLLRHKPEIAGVVIADFDTQYKSQYYQSEADTAANVQVQPMVAAAILLARTLHNLASPGGVPAVPLKVSNGDCMVLAVKLATCLMMDGAPPQQSLLCDFVKQYVTVGFTNRNAQGEIAPFPWRYVGIAYPDTPDATNVTNKREIFNFLFQYMTNMTANNWTSIPCDPFVNFCPAGLVCYGWRYGQDVSKNLATMGRCLNATARFTIATSTRIAFDNTTTRPVMLLINETREQEFNQKYGWPPDPVWTESDWTEDSPTVTVYMAEAKSVQVAVLVSGLILTVGTGLASWYMKRIFEATAVRKRSGVSRSRSRSTPGRS